MTIKSFKHILTTPSVATSATPAFWLNTAIGMRNQMRSLLTYSGSPWKVSDVAEYTPPANAANRGYVWVVRHLAGPEWLFIIGVRTTFNTSTPVSEFAAGTWRKIGDNLAQVSLNFHMLLHYNTDYTAATYNMQFDDVTNMTYTVPDSKVFTAPNWPLDTSFYPANTLDGSALNMVAVTYSTDPRLQRLATLFSFEDTAPSISAVSYRAQQLGAPGDFLAVGEIIDPVDPLDTGATRRTGTFGATISFALGSSIGPQGGVSNLWARFYNAADVPQNASSWAFTGDKTILNDTTAGGVFTARPIPLGNSKGALDPKFFLEVGALNDYARYGIQMLTADNNVLVKINGVNTIPWQTGLDFFAW